MDPLATHPPQELKPSQAFPAYFSIDSAVRLLWSQVVEQNVLEMAPL